MHRSMITVSILLAACTTKNSPVTNPPPNCLGSSASEPLPPKTRPPVMLPPVTPTPAMVEPMRKLERMRGVWIGKASGFAPDGSKFEVTQTERVGPMLGGEILVVEGRGHKVDGTTGFNAFGIISWNRHTNKYEMRSYTQGQSGTFDLEPTADGYVWTIPARPGSVVRFTATFENHQWREVGHLVTSDQVGPQMFEMNLTRVGDTDWPLGTPIDPKP